MAKNVEIELNYAGVGEILKSAEIRAELQKHAARIADGGRTETYIAGTRAVANAYGKADNSMLRRLK